MLWVLLEEAMRSDRSCCWGYSSLLGRVARRVVAAAKPMVLRRCEVRQQDSLVLCYVALTRRVQS